MKNYNLNDRLTLKNSNKIYWLLLMFPIYFGPNGLYGVNESLFMSSQMIFPLGLWASLIIVCYVFLSPLIKRRNVYLNDCSIMVIVICVLTVLLGVIGATLSHSFFSIINCLQLLSGLCGLILAIWFFNYLKLDFFLSTAFISQIFFVNIILNLIYHCSNFGFTIIDRHSYSPSTPFWGIYHAYVYYPMIISLVFLFALPYWRERLNNVWFYALYFFIFMYLWMYQVRTDILGFSVTFAIFVLFFEKRRAKLIACIMLTAAILFVFSMGMLDQSRFFGFGGDLSSGVAGRFGIYASFFNRIKEHWSYLLYGSLFYGRDIAQFSDRFLGHSYHNQYIQLVSDGGIILLLCFIILGILGLKTILNNIKNTDRIVAKRFHWWICVIAVFLLIEFNTQVPLKVTNPAMYLWFYASGIFIYSRKSKQYDRILKQGDQ